MITQKVIDVTKAPVDAIAHQANCFHIMGGGVARAIRETFPAAYEADLKTKRGDRKKLGTYSRAVVNDGKLAIYNVYSQYDLAPDFGERATQYDMVVEGLTRVRDDLEGSDTLIDTKSLTLGIPLKYGCALGGGSWRIVEAIIHDIFERSTVDVLLCEWPAPVVGISGLQEAIKRARGDTPPQLQVGYA